MPRNLSTSLPRTISRDALNSNPAAAMPLAPGLRRQFENLFGCGLAGVSIHAGPPAERLNAAAFAVGDRVYFSPGAYNPVSSEGRRLLGHELAHVVQYRQGRTPRGASGTMPIVERPGLEAEAERFGALAQDIVDAPGPHSARGWHPRPLAADCVVQRSVLRRDNKNALFTALEDLVKQIPPKTGFDADAYAQEVYDFIMAHPHIFSGEKFEFGSAKPGEKLPGTLGGKISTYQIQVGQRIQLTSLDNNDKKWILRSLKRLATKHRFPNSFTKIRTQIVSDGDNQWVNWTSSDCVFTAILIVLGLRFVGKGEPVEGYELLVETDLANQLAIPKRTIPDHLLVVLLEERLGWKRQPAESLDELYAEAQSGSQYVVSYCENERTDFWHTVYGKCKGKNSWTWVDRQYERKFGQIRTSLRGDLSCEANAWLIDETAALVGTLRGQLQVNTLKTTYKANIE
jgi:Domain of unknown function (DUF4157)